MAGDRSQHPVCDTFMWLKGSERRQCIVLLCGYSSGTCLELPAGPVIPPQRERLICGDAARQGRFAEGLASCINNHLGPQEQQQSPPLDSDMTDLAPLLQQQVCPRESVASVMDAPDDSGQSVPHTQSQCCIRLSTAFMEGPCILHLQRDLKA